MLVATAADTKYREMAAGVVRRATALGYGVQLYDLGGLGAGRPSPYRGAPMGPRDYYLELPSGWKSRALHKPATIADALAAGVFVLYVDADTILRAAVDELAEPGCDVCVTARRPSEIAAEPKPENREIMGRFNAGVVGVAPTEAGRAFVRDWVDATGTLGNDQLALNRLVNPDGGPRGGDYVADAGLRVRVVPADLYNFYYFPEDPGPAKILHFKQGLRSFYAGHAGTADEPTPEFAANARAIHARHDAQGLEDAWRLADRYRRPILPGPARPIDLLAMLGWCVDPTDKKLGLVDQLTHTLQVVEAMEADGADDEMVFVGLVHDLGKLLLRAGEDPANVVCMAWVLGDPGPGVGLRHCTLTFNHDEFGHMRLRPHVSDRVAWLVRHHSLVDDPTRPGDPAAAHARYLDDADRAWLPDLQRLRRWDVGSKSRTRRPAAPLAKYAPLLRRFLPEWIDF